MKTRIQNLFVAVAMMQALGLILAGRVKAQTFTNLYTFTEIYNDSNGTNSDGANPTASLILSGSTLYGTTYDGGTFGYGTVFAINMDGTGFTNLYNFAGYPSDGANPTAGLILSSNTLYGTTYDGGVFNDGTVFKINTNGTGFTNIYTFTGGDGGGNPNSGVILSGNILYGTTFQSPGTVFKVKMDGTGFTNIYAFTGIGDDGNLPSSLILSSNILFGTTPSGGSSGAGTVFAVNIDGSGFTNLYSFTQPYGDYYTNSDGAEPQAGLILSGNRLYGTASDGGTNGFGTVFAVNTDGSGFTNLYSFTQPYGDYYTNSDGFEPQAGLILSGNKLYGTASDGGTNGFGTVFAVNTNGTGFTNLHSFIFTDGAGPQASLILSSNTLYGTATSGGNPGQPGFFFAGDGTVFSISLAVSPPQLTIALSGTNIIISWPYPSTGWTLRQNSDLRTANWLPRGGISNDGTNNFITITSPMGNLFFRLSNP